MGASNPALQLIAAVLVWLLPLALAVVLPRGSRLTWLAVAITATIGTISSVLVDIATDSPADAPARVLDAALAGALAATVALLACRRLGAVGGGAFAVTWSMIVYQPVAAVTIGTVPPIAELVFGTIDLAGVLATHIAAAGSLLILSVLPAPAVDTVPRSAQPGWVRATVAALMLLTAATAWMLGVDRVLDEGTARILLNALIGLSLAAGTWLVLERISRGTITPTGLVAGVAAGWAAIGMASALLAPVAMVPAAMLGAAAGSWFFAFRRADARGGIRGISRAMIAAAATGGIIIGLLADGIALSSTGSLGLVVAQVVAIGAVTIVAVVGGILCWALGAGVAVMTKRWAIPDSN